MRGSTYRFEPEEDQEPLLQMSRAEVDPYYSVRDHVQSQIERAKVKYDKFKDMVANTDTSNNPEFKELRKTLVKDLRAVDKDLKGLKEAVETVDKNRAKFVHIKDSELASRKKFVEDAQQSITSIKNGIESTGVRKKMEEDELRSKRDSYDDANSALITGINQENNRFIKDQKVQIHKNIQDQDKAIEQLGTHVDRLGEIGRTINTEVKEQTILLDKLETEIDEASTKMGQVEQALGKLLKTKDSCQIWTVVILALILIILVALVIWT